MEIWTIRALGSLEAGNDCFGQDLRYWINVILRQTQKNGLVCVLDVQKSSELDPIQATKRRPLSR